ncbi:hypothetical protein L1987_11960 [Smallanthus sonchifolius]|uniref:Uncharacterized protein n=1 Tax=Smallanthus sonchifolius TaxID=185202 RepID=A0ACB9JFV1_9ASTR|nr:hypothetical protein L1987_11960 [Smallanthus sonchifolius]
MSSNLIILKGSNIVRSSAIEVPENSVDIHIKNKRLRNSSYSIILHPRSLCLYLAPLFPRVPFHEFFSEYDTPFSSFPFRRMFSLIFSLMDCGLLRSVFTMMYHRRHVTR